MRILHVTDTYAPTLGGIEVLVESLARRQQVGGHDVSVLTRTAAGTLTGGDVTGPRVTRDPARLAELVAGADVVHAHVSAISPLAFRSAEQAALTGVPVVATVHSMWGALWPLFRGTALARGWPDLPIQWAAVSEVAADTVRRAIGGGPVLVLPNAIDTTLWSPAPAPEPGSRDRHTLTVVSAQRMARRKRPLPLLAMLRALRSALPPQIRLEAVLVGDGPQLSSVRAAISAARMGSWVHTPGSFTHTQLRELYVAADLFVAPATFESFGIAALEARACGLPIVARADTGVAEFVTHGTDGLLAAGDADMVRQLRRLCTDTALRTAITEHNRATPPPFDWSDTLWRLDHAYATAARAHARVRPQLLERA